MSRNQEETEYGVIEALTETMRLSGARQAEVTYNISKLCVNVRIVVVDLNYNKK